MPRAHAQRPASNRRRAIAGLALAALLVSTTAGCLRPTLTISSEPSGARVLVNGEYHGITPVEVPFIWYWYKEVELRREGYDTLRSRERMYAPPYFYIPLDLVFELLPFQIHDKRYRHYFLTPEQAPELNRRYAAAADSK
jgi:hypothetical protein